MKGIADHLGHDKSFYTFDIKWIFNFFNYLDNLMTQCFTSSGCLIYVRVFIGDS